MVGILESLWSGTRSSASSTENTRDRAVSASSAADHADSSEKISATKSNASLTAAATTSDVVASSGVLSGASDEKREVIAVAGETKEDTSARAFPISYSRLSLESLIQLLKPSCSQEEIKKVINELQKRIEASNVKVDSQSGLRRRTSRATGVAYDITAEAARVRQEHVRENGRYAGIFEICTIQ